MFNRFIHNLYLLGKLFLIQFKIQQNKIIFVLLTEIEIE